LSKSPDILTLKEVARRLDRAGIAWAVFAGAAASVYGATRPLTDVDILVSTAEGKRVADLFPDAQIKRGQDGSPQIVQLPGIDLVAGLATRYADATFAMEVDDQMTARLRRHEIAGVIVPVIPPEDNILIKAIWRRGPEVGKHDWEDVEEMMTHLPDLDWAYLRWRADTCGAGQRAQRALDLLEKLRPAGGVQVGCTSERASHLAT